jgi:formate dehydrogenase (NADP+) alpha subunit
MVTLSVNVDGLTVQVEPGASVLDAVNLAAIPLPQLCKDPHRPRLGTCRTCLVGIEGMRGAPTACSTPVTDGMIVHTDDPHATRIRRGVLQLTIDMLSEEDVTRTGDLANAADSHGVTRGRFLPDSAIASRRERVDESNPFWLLDHARCILCERCIDACQKVQHISAIALLDHAAGSEIGVFRHGPVIESNCTSCGQCWATCPTHAIRLKSVISTGPNGRPLAQSGVFRDAPSLEPRGDGLPAIVRQVETTCPYCGVGCGIVLNLSERGEIVQVDGVPENESSQGMLCVKGRYGLGFVHSPDRLTTPLVRSRPGGPLEPTSWDEALDLVADRFAEYRGRFGALGSAKATNEDGYVVQKFARVVMATNNVDHCARLCHSPSMVGMTEMLGGGSTTNSYADFERAGCIMVVGSDTDANHPVIAARIRKAVEENGTTLIIVNPRRTRLCDIADLWLRPKPGTDVALFNGLARIALDEELWNREFVEGRTADFEAWRSAIAAYDALSVAAVTGIPEDQLRQAARLFARPEHGNSCLLWGMGITQHTNGTANVQAMVNLALLTGQIGKPGSGLSPLRGQNNVQGCCDAGVLPDTLPGYQGLGSNTREKFGRAWGCDIPEQPGLRLTEMIDAAHRRELSALYLCGENPLLTEANLNHAHEALGRLDFLVVQSVLPNETTEVAHVVLPSACFAEKDGTFTNSERRVQLVRKALEPPGEAREDWEITCEIARRVAARLGLPDRGFQYRQSSEIWNEMASLVPAFAGITHERLENGGIQWPCPTPDHAGTPLLYNETFPRGKAKFVAAEQGAAAAELPDREFPLLLNTGRVLYHWHGGDLTRQVEGLVDLYPDVQVSIHPADAESAGITHGEPVHVSSRRGALTGRAHVTDTVRAGEIFIPFVQLQGAAANMLTNNVYDPRAKIPEYKVSAVRIASADKEQT